MSLWLFCSSTSNMVFGSAWVTTPSRTTASSFWGSPSGLLWRRRAERRGPRLGVEDLAKTLSLRSSDRRCGPDTAAGGRRGTRSDPAPDQVRQLARTRLELDPIVDRAEREAPLDQLRIVQAGENGDGQGRGPAVRAQRRQHPEPIHAREPHVEQDQAPPGLEGKRQGGLAG